MRDTLRRALLENLLEVFFILDRFQAGCQKRRRAFRETLNAPLDGAMFAFWKNLARRYVPYLPEACSDTVGHQPASNSLCSRDVFLVAGHFASDLECEICDRIEVTYWRNREEQMLPAKNRTMRFTKVSDLTACVTVAAIPSCFYVRAQKVVSSNKSKRLKNVSMNHRKYYLN